MLNFEISTCFYLCRFVHLFFADMKASLLLAEFEECARANADTTPPKQHRHHLEPEHMRFELLPPLEGDHAHANSACLKGERPFLKLHAQAVALATNTSTPAAGKWEGWEGKGGSGSSGGADGGGGGGERGTEFVASGSSASRHSHGLQLGDVESRPPGAWRLTEDRPGKHGWVREILHPNPEPQHQHPLHAASISHLRPAPNASLTFSPTGEQKDLLAGDETLEYFISIHYLRTYKNGGVVEVWWCNQLVGALDALWDDLNHRVSVNVVYSVHIKHARAGGVWSYNMIMCPPNTPSSAYRLTITHVPQSKEGGVGEDDADKGHGQRFTARGQQKFKVVGVTICKEANE